MAYAPRGVAIVVRAYGKTYYHAITRAMSVFERFYGDESSTRLYAINTAHVASPRDEDEKRHNGSYAVDALGLHRDGEVLHCNTNYDGGLYLPHNTPCIHGKTIHEVGPGDAPTSTIGQNRGGRVVLPSGTGWHDITIPEVVSVSVNPDGSIWPEYKPPGYDQNMPTILP